MLSPERACIFRLVHRDNVPLILAHGVLSMNAAPVGLSYRSIGLDDLIDRRASRVVPVAPGGTLADYAPFYFTPCTPMAYRVLTGRGVPQRNRTDLVYLLSSLDAVEQARLRYVVTDRHAVLDLATFATDRSLLSGLPWDNWRRRDFRRDPDDLESFDRYQAEVLVHKSLPAGALHAIITADEASQAEVHQQVTAAGAQLRTLVRSEWYPG
jgi:hypothetical protein